MTMGQGNWLQNSSFDPSLFSQQLAAAQSKSNVQTLLALAESSSEEEEEEQAPRFTSEGQASPSRKRSHDGELKHHKKKKRKSEHKHRSKKSHRNFKENDTDQRYRFTWIEDLASATADGRYCMDASKKGENLVYQKTYAYDKPAFRRSTPQPIWVFQSLLDNASLSGPARKKQKRFTTRSAKLLETDVNRLRYCMQTDRTNPHVHGLSLHLPLPAFIPIADNLPETSDDVKRESELQAMRRRTIAYNRTTVEDPNNLQNWLDFAAFQDEFHSFMAAQKEGTSGKTERSVAEKKVDILQRALKHHPESAEIICCLIDSTKVFEDLKETQARYEDGIRDPVYRRHPRLWLQYIHFQKHELLPSNRLLTTVGDILQLHNKAMQALTKERARLLSAGKIAAAETVETALVDLLLDSCRVSMQAGHTEASISRIQAVLEFTLLGPNWSTAVRGPGGDHVRLPLFEEYWRSGVPLIGEEHCKGWQDWALSHQDPNIPPPPPPPDPEDLVPGGWSGWKELEIEPEPDALQQILGDAPVVDSDEDADDDFPESDGEEEEERLSRLLEEEAQNLQSGSSLSQEVLLAWTALERRRDRCNWQPQRSSGVVSISGAAESEDADTVEHRDSHLIQFEDIEPCLFSFMNQDNLKYVVNGMLRLLDLPVHHQLSSNTEICNIEMNARSSMWPLLLRTLNTGKSSETASMLSWLSPDYSAEQESNPLLAKQGYLLWFQADVSRHSFVREMLGLLISTGAMCMDSSLCEALVHVTAEEYLIHKHLEDQGGREGEEAALKDLGVFEDRGNKSSHPEKQENEVQIGKISDIRESLGSLLQAQSDGSPLWTAYATHEVLHGNVKRGRRSFEAYLVNLSKSSASKLATANVVLAFAKAETQRGSKSSTDVALHALSWLSLGLHPYQPFSHPPASQDSRVLEARQGFQREISRLVSQNGLDEDEGAYLLAAALYETLVLPQQPNAGTQLLRNALMEFPPEVRQRSSVLERIFMEVCSALVKDMQQQLIAPRVARKAVLSALQDYPRSPVLVSLLIQVEQKSFLVTRLRVDLRDMCEEHGSVPLWLLTANLEFDVTRSTSKLKQFFKGAQHHEVARNSPLWQRVCFAVGLLCGKDNLDILFAHMTDGCSWVKDVWMDGLKFEGNHRYRLSEAERKNICMRTSLDEVIYTLAGERLESKEL